MLPYKLILIALRYSLAQIRPARPHILIACMPKSASSFLVTCVNALPCMRRTIWTPRPTALTLSSSRREQELDVIRLMQNHHRAYAAQNHIRFTPETDILLQKYGVTPVALTRNLFDVVASLRDHIRRESHQFPMAWLDESHSTFPDDKLEEMIAELVMPWYIQFFVSWNHCKNVLWVSYDEVRQAPEDVLARITRHANVDSTKSEIENAVNVARSTKTTKTRVNYSMSGRGDEISASARDHINKLTRHYPSIDFRPIGIEPCL